MNKRGLTESKKAKVSIEFLISVIILVIGFVVVLYFLFLADLNPAIDKEACHQSIVYRATASLKAFDLKQAIPLKCQTEKICLSMSGNDCELSSTKNNPVKKIKLGRDSEKAKEKIMEVFADSLVSCHSMLGEGKLNFMPKKLTTKTYGLICTRIVFDKEAREKINGISYGELYGYLGKKTIEDKSYLEYLYPSWKGSPEKTSINLFELFKKDNNALKNIDFKDWKIDLKQEKGYAIIAQLAPSGNWQSWAAGIGTAVAIPIGVALIATGVGAPAGVILIGSIGTITTASVVAGGAVFWYSYSEEYDYAPPAIFPYDINLLKNLGVYSFEIAP